MCTDATNSPILLQFSNFPQSSQMVTTVSMTTFKHTDLTKQPTMAGGAASGKQADNETNCYLLRAATHCSSYNFQRYISHCRAVKMYNSAQERQLYLQFLNSAINQNCQGVRGCQPISVAPFFILPLGCIDPKRDNKKFPLLGCILMRCHLAS